MLKILKKIKFKEQDDRMSNVGAVEKVIENFIQNTIYTLTIYLKITAN